jgi:hypothetical protein
MPVDTEDILQKKSWAALFWQFAAPSDSSARSTGRKQPVVEE